MVVRGRGGNTQIDIIVSSYPVVTCLREFLNMNVRSKRPSEHESEHQANLPTQNDACPHPRRLRHSGPWSWVLLCRRIHPLVRSQLERPSPSYQIPNFSWILWKRSGFFHL